MAVEINRARDDILNARVGGLRDKILNDRREKGNVGAGQNTQGSRVRCAKDLPVLPFLRQGKLWQNERG
jgi:hypothetical protein